MLQQTAHRNDRLILDEVESVNESRELKPNKLFADSNYISGDKIRKYQDDNRILMGYIQKDTSKKPDDFKLEKFEIDFNKHSAICPEGKRSIKYTTIKNEEYCIYFDKNDCQNCSNFYNCVGKSKNKKRV